jgi:hypothetical protein
MLELPYQMTLAEKKSDEMMATWTHAHRIWPKKNEANNKYFSPNKFKRCSHSILREEQVQMFRHDALMSTWWKRQLVRRRVGHSLVPVPLGCGVRGHQETCAPCFSTSRSPSSVAAKPRAKTSFVYERKEKQRRKTPMTIKCHLI